MNHPRRLLLLVPLALSGAALLVRARLPRPQSAGDKWLWEQAEQAPSLIVEHGVTGLSRAKQLNVGLVSGFRTYPVLVTERQGIRALLRAFEDTGPFLPERDTDPPAESAALFRVSLGASLNSIMLCAGPKGYYVYRYPEKECATTNSRSVEQFLQILRSTVVKARHKQSGYSFGSPMIFNT